MTAVVLTTGAEVPGRMHRPLWQFCPDGQMFPHDPQFADSFWRSLQVPLQDIRPEMHDPCVTVVVEPDDDGDVTLLFFFNVELNCPFSQVSP